jgi:hypothetical protein
MPTTDFIRPDGAPPTGVSDLTVTVVEDPLRARHGFPISSPYVEVFWLSHLGPASTCLLRLTDRLTRQRPDRQLTVPVVELATMIGTPGTGSKNSTITRRLDRLVRFGAAHWDAADHSELTVWSHIDTVPIRLQTRWPEWLRDAHGQAVGDRAGR